MFLNPGLEPRDVPSQNVASVVANVSLPRKLSLSPSIQFSNIYVCPAAEEPAQADEQSEFCLDSCCII